MKKTIFLNTLLIIVTFEGRRGHDSMVVGFIITYAISVYYHKRCEFEFRTDEARSIQHYVIKLGSDLRHVGGFLRVLMFPPPIKLIARYS